MKCSTCKFVNQTEKGDCFCRYNPPVYDPNHRYGQFPKVNPNSSCGQYKSN